MTASMTGDDSDMTRFWFQRIERTCASLLTEELKAGRLRQGWSNSHDLDLRTISADRERGKPLSEAQKQCWRGNRRLLPTEPDSVKPGDYIIIPHLPEEGLWSLVKVTGGYRYEEDKAFGHILEVKLLNRDQPINPRCAAVAAALRRTATTRSRMWNIDHLAEQVHRLVKAVERGDNVSQPEPEAEKLANIHKLATTAIEDGLREKFHGSEFEKPVEMLLKQIYGEGNVIRRAGPSEHGADFVCSSMDGLGIQHYVAVQVKMWEGTAVWQHPLDQIRRAYEAHETDDTYETISAGVVLAMVERFDEAFKAKKECLEKELSIPIHLLGRKEVVNLFMKHLPDLVLVLD